MIPTNIQNDYNNLILLFINNNVDNNINHEINELRVKYPNIKVNNDIQLPF